jgi:pilus assembly protein CpaC
MKAHHHPVLAPLAWVLFSAAAVAQTQAQPQPAIIKGNTTAAAPTAVHTASPQVAALAPGEFSTVGQPMDLVIGKSTLMRLPGPVERISVGNPAIADIALIGNSEIYLLGKSYGSTNLMIWRKGGGSTAVDVNVSIDAQRMEKKIRELLPDEPQIRVRPAADSVILTGTVASAVKAKYAEDIANAYMRDINRTMLLPVMAGDTKVASGTTMAATGTTSVVSAKVVNLLQINQGQQVMLEVKVAEISKNLLERLGVNLTASAGNGGISYGIFSQLLSSDAGRLFTITGDNGNKFTLDASKTDDLFKVLAEPKIIAISGQEASFLAGGKIFIPVISPGVGGSYVTLQEKEYGVGVKFMPTVLEGGRIHLRVAPEVSDVGKGSSFQVAGTSYLIPNINTNRVQTTVQLQDGQSLAIAGLIKNNVTESVSRIPLLGDLPILGALFRSSEFKNDRTELMFLITPRLVKPIEGPVALPTDSFKPPSRTEFFLGGKLEGSGHPAVVKDPGEAPAPTPPSDEQAQALPPKDPPPAPPSGGFDKP